MQSKQTRIRLSKKLAKDLPQEYLASAGESSKSSMPARERLRYLSRYSGAHPRDDPHRGSGGLCLGSII